MSKVKFKNESKVNLKELLDLSETDVKRFKMYLPYSIMLSRLILYNLIYKIYKKKLLTILEAKSE